MHIIWRLHWNYAYGVKMMKRSKENIEEEYRNQLIAIQGDRESLRKYRHSQAKLILNVTLVYIPFIMISSLKNTLKL